MSDNKKKRLLISAAFGVAVLIGLTLVFTHFTTKPKVQAEKDSFHYEAKSAGRKGHSVE